MKSFLSFLNVEFLLGKDSNKNWRMLLFISLLPLHKDNFERQLAFFCVGIERLNEIFGLK